MAMEVLCGPLTVGPMGPARHHAFQKLCEHHRVMG